MPGRHGQPQKHKTQTLQTSEVATGNPRTLIENESCPPRFKIPVTSPNAPRDRIKSHSRAARAKRRAACKVSSDEPPTRKNSIGCPSRCAFDSRGVRRILRARPPTARCFCRPVRPAEKYWREVALDGGSKPKKEVKLYIEEKGISDLLDHVHPLHRLRPIQTNGRMNGPGRKTDRGWRGVATTAESAGARGGRRLEESKRPMTVGRAWGKGAGLGAEGQSAAWRRERGEREGDRA